LDAVQPGMLECRAGLNHPMDLFETGSDDTRFRLSVGDCMRIIAGSRRGMRLLSPKGDLSRPIIDRVKESLFSVLYKYDLPDGAVVADLFSGVGSLGLEALSRGAASVTFVEHDRTTAAILEKNIARAGFADQSAVVRTDAFVIGAPAGPAGRYGLVFVDPPYARTRDAGPDSALAGLFELLDGQVADGAIAVVRTQDNVQVLDAYRSFGLLERRVWGTMAVALFAKGGCAGGTTK